MSSLAQYVKDVLGGAASLAAGLGVTIRYMFKPVVTEQYPRVRLKIPQAFRGHVELALDGATKDHLCIACGMCANACPSGVITVVGAKKKPAPAAAKKDEPKKAEGEAKEPKERGRPDKFSIDFSRCSLCGLCVETCPKGALRFSHVYEQAGPSRGTAVVDLLLRHKAMVEAGCDPRTTTQQQAA